MNEVLPRTDRTVPRILWKFGFEIPRHDDVLERLGRRLHTFQELLAQIDLKAGEGAREKLRAEGVNLFVSAEEFFDRVLAFNLWMLSSDHWHETRFEYRLGDGRRTVGEVLGDRLDTPDGYVTWKPNGENALGTQLAYLSAFERWLDALSTKERTKRSDNLPSRESDEFDRRFPFRHTQLWGDADIIELERYKELVRKSVRYFLQADVAGVRNALDHQRDPTRFPSEQQLLLCITCMQNGVKAAALNRVYPVTYWLESTTRQTIGTTEYTFASLASGRYSLFRPATVCSLPDVSVTHPVIFAPVNFLGAADSIIPFKVMGESEYSRYWAGFPRILREIPEASGLISAEAGLRDGQ